MTGLPPGRIPESAAGLGVAHPAPFAQAISDMSAPFHRQPAALAPSGPVRRFGGVLAVLDEPSLPALPRFSRPLLEDAPPFGTLPAISSD